MSGLTFFFFPLILSSRIHGYILHDVQVTKGCCAAAAIVPFILCFPPGLSIVQEPLVALFSQLILHRQTYGKSLVQWLGVWFRVRCLHSNSSCVMFYMCLGSMISNSASLFVRFGVVINLPTESLEEKIVEYSAECLHLMIKQHMFVAERVDIILPSLSCCAHMDDKNMGKIFKHWKLDEKAFRQRAECFLT